MQRIDIGALAREAGATVELTRAGLEREERATAAMCRLSVAGDGEVLLARGPFDAEGYTGRKVTLRADPAKADMRRLDAFLKEIGRLQARERAVEGHATATSPYPAWSFTVDALAAEIARLDGVDLTKCSRPATWRRTVERYHGRLASPRDAWDWSREMHHVRGAGAWDDPMNLGSVTEAQMRGTRLVMRILNPKDSPVFMREEPAGVDLYVPGTFPDTTMSAMRGKTVRDVVGIECDHVVVSARAGGSGASDMTVLRVKGGRVPLAPVPEGVDAWWLGED